jgi:hypothetical protein
MSDNFESLLNDLNALEELRKSSAVTSGSDDVLSGLGKSFALKLENGDELEAVDGTELVKSLITRLDTQESTVAERNETLQKALGVTVDLIKGLSAEVGTLRTQFAAFGSGGAGRKTTVSISEKPSTGTMQKSEPDGMSAHAFLAKAEEAMNSGRITGMDLSLAETSVNRGVPVRDDIVRRVLG